MRAFKRALYIFMFVRVFLGVRTNMRTETCVQSVACIQTCVQSVAHMRTKTRADSKSSKLAASSAHCPQHCKTASPFELVYMQQPQASSAGRLRATLKVAIPSEWTNEALRRSSQAPQVLLTPASCAYCD